MILVYVAGPYRARTDSGVQRNIRSAEEHALALAKAGAGRIAPVVPHTAYRFFEGEFPDAYFLASTMEIMRRCDAVAVAPGWGLSEGTEAELAEAERLRIPRFLQPEPADQAAAILAHAVQEDLLHALTLRVLARRREAA